eukprot:31374-Pelagococcus_subviridis.AAC.13
MEKRPSQARPKRVPRRFPAAVAAESGDPDGEHRGRDRPPRAAEQHDRHGEADIRGHPTVGVHVFHRRAHLRGERKVFTQAHRGDAAQARPISHWSPYDRVGVVNADP